MSHVSSRRTKALATGASYPDDIDSVRDRLPMMSYRSSYHPFGRRSYQRPKGLRETFTIPLKDRISCRFCAETPPMTRAVHFEGFCTKRCQGSYARWYPDGKPGDVFSGWSWAGRVLKDTKDGPTVLRWIRMAEEGLMSAEDAGREIRDLTVPASGGGDDVADQSEVSL